jgi:Domain of unknown function (DUF1905)/Bacteriocin-protection, YdeI or OmpD-Associated
VRAELEIIEEIRLVGVNPYVAVSAEQATLLRPNWRGPMPVILTINDQSDDPWRTNMMPNGQGGYLLYLHGQMRAFSGTNVGDVVTIGLCFDDDYRGGPQHPVPSWLHEALTEEALVANNWHALAPSRQKEVLRYLASLKSDSAVQRNQVRLLNALRGERERFMGRDWVDGK